MQVNYVDVDPVKSYSTRTLYVTKVNRLFQNVHQLVLISIYYMNYTTTLVCTIMLQHCHCIIVAGSTALSLCITDKLMLLPLLSQHS